MQKTSTRPALPLAQLAAQTCLRIGRMDADHATKNKASLVLQDFLGGLFAARTGAFGPLALGFQQRSVPGAQTEALVMGMLGHSLIREDMHVQSGTHPGVVILPAMLALARREQLSGAALQRGIVAGYHAMGTLGGAARHGLTQRHFRPIGISGAFGAAAGAIAATGVGEDTAVQALGFAANFAAGLNQWPWSGGQEIYVHAGLAARNGLLALDLARAGLRSSPDILEGVDGLFAAIGSGDQAEPIFRDRIDGPPCILEVTHKPVAGCNLVQTAAAAALQLRTRLGEGALREIRRIEIATFSLAKHHPGCDSPGPFDHVVQRKMSFCFAIAAALYYGRLDEASYALEVTPLLAQLMASTEVVVDPRFEQRRIPYQPARLTLWMQDGSREALELDDVPWLGEPQVRSRFHAETAQLLSADESRRLERFLDTLAEQPDLGLLWGLLDRA